MVALSPKCFPGNQENLSTPPELTQNKNKTRVWLCPLAILALREGLGKPRSSLSSLLGVS